MKVLIEKKFPVTDREDGIDREMSVSIAIERKGLPPQGHGFAYADPVVVTIHRQLEGFLPTETAIELSQTEYEQLLEAGRSV